LICLLLYYRVLGVVAVLGLLVYALLFYAVIVLWRSRSPCPELRVSS